jgi:hypothetical protein
MRSPHKWRAAPALAGDGPQDADRLASAIKRIDKPNGHSSQAQCDHCRCALLARKRGGPGRQQRFCSTACRVASKREKERFESSGYNHPAVTKSLLKQ